MLARAGRGCVPKMWQVLAMAAVLVFVLVPAVNSSNVADGADVVVYGATPAGIAAAVSATRQGSSVMLIEQHSSVGGMTAGGLGWDDVDCPYCPTESAIPAATVPSRSVYGDSLYSHFAAKVMAHYALVSATALELSMNGTRHEPHVAEQIFISMLKEANVTVLTGWRLSSVSVKDGIVASLTVKPAEREGTAKVVAGRAFVDGTYEGDLLEKAGLPYTIGREDRAKYGELNAGVVFQDNVAHHFLRGSTGEASRAVPAMTWRLCFSTAPTRKLMTAPPENYNRSVYLGYLADVAAKRIESVWNAWSHLRALPPDGSKFDINCNPRPLGFIWAGGRKDEYINATYVRRKELLVELRDITLGLLWFQQHDDAVPAVQRALHQKYGLCADEFHHNGNFPPQLYIREARRLVGRSRLTEQSIVPVVPTGRPPLVYDAVAISSFAIDSFPCTERVPAPDQQSSSTAMEGYVGMESEMVAPSTLPATIMLPDLSRDSPRNVIVPTAVSASHVAFSAVRLEPTWMMLGSAAGIIATLGIQGDEGLSRPLVVGREDLETKSSAAVAVDLARVRLVDVQRQIIGQGQPLVYFSDMLVGESGWADLQLIAPHTFDALDGFAARPRENLSRAIVIKWIGAALQAANSTLGRAGRPGALLPVPQPGKEWPDYRPGDADFTTAAALAVVGAATPRPGLGQAFHPQQHVYTVDVQVWASRAASLLPKSFGMSRSSSGSTTTGNSNGDGDNDGEAAFATRSQAATIIADALLGGPA